MSRHNNIIWKLLKTNISKGQILGYSIANLVGLSVILSGLLFFCDSRHQIDEEDTFFSNDYIVVSKRVQGITSEIPTFSEDEIARLQSFPWVKKAGAFTPSQFPVKASLSMGNRGMSTYLFFESVPDEYFDILPVGWEFDPQKPFIPIILSKEYLGLYNYGFALPQGMPQVSEEVASRVPLTITITDTEGASYEFPAQIVGFSSRLNTVAVPQQFMDWANRKFSLNQPRDPSRLILEIDRLTATGMEDYFETEGIEVGGQSASTEKISNFLSLISTVVTVTGLIISALSFFILLLSISLLLQKNREKIRNLVLLGYTPRTIAGYYVRLVTVINLLVTLLSLSATLLLRHLWSGPLSDLGLGEAPLLPLLMVSLGIFVLQTLFSLLRIRAEVKKAEN